MTVSVVGSNNETVVFQTRKVKGSDLETDRALLNLDDIPIPSAINTAKGYNTFSEFYNDLPDNESIKGPPGDQGPAIDSVSLAQSVDLSTVTMTFGYTQNNQGFTIGTTPSFTIPAGPKGDTGTGIQFVSHDTQNNTLTFQFTDTLSDLTVNLPQGDTGPAGRSISSISKSGDVMTINYDDGSSPTQLSGIRGPAGDAATVTVSATNTLAAGSSATVTETGTSNAQNRELIFGIPAGADGVDGTGFTGGSYDAATGVVTFTSNDNLGFTTGDLRGADGVDGDDGVSITDVNQVNSTTINFSKSDSTTTSNITLPVPTAEDILPTYTSSDANKVLALNSTGDDFVWIAGSGTGTVTSVGITGSNGISVTGSPVTTSGSIGVSLSLGANLTYNASTQQIDATDTDTTYSVADANNDGLMSSSDFSKLSGIAAQANKYVLPAATTTDLGGIKVGTNLSITQDGTLSATDTDTTYSVADAQTDGLMSSSDFSKLGTVESNARALPSYTNNGGKVLSLTSGVSPALQWEDRPEVSISGTTNYDYISLDAATQVITINQVDLATDVTGTLPSSNLSTNLNAIDGLTNTDGYFIVGSATGWVVEKDSTVRTSLGLGSIATQAADAVNIDGGAIDGVTIGTNAVVTDLRVDNLQLDGNTISSTDTNGNLALSPNGTGNVVLGNFTFDADQTVGLSEDNYVLTYDHSTTSISLEAPSGLSTVDLTADVGSSVLPVANGGTGLTAGGSNRDLLAWDSTSSAWISTKDLSSATYKFATVNANFVKIEDSLTAPTNEKYSHLRSVSGTIKFETLTDAGASGATIFDVTRTGTTVDTFDFKVTPSVNGTDLLSGTVGVANGGTGLTTLGSAGQVLRVNGTGNGLEYGTVSGGGGITEDQAIAYAIALG